MIAYSSNADIFHFLYKHEKQLIKIIYIYKSVLFARFARNHKVYHCNLNVLYGFKDEEDGVAIARKLELAQHIVDMKQRLVVEEKMLRAKEEALLIGKHLYQFMLN